MKKSINKDITFIYQDTAERNLFEPIAVEAHRRGFNTRWSMNKLEKCEIGFYCQHVNFPQFSKFSVIMLHDIIQQYSNWPDLWLREPWNKYDIGILPSKQWVENWEKCSQWYYTRPKLGMFEIGWPKADTINNILKMSEKEQFIVKYNLDSTKKTVLYAPAWENDGKEDDFVRSMMPLDVNILIKQADVSEELFPNTYRNIKQMYELHKDNPHVIYLPPSLNIFEAIAVSDILVSEESSTMCEAAMMKVPAISVSDWLIPDVTPSRFPKCDYNFVTKTLKSDLTKCVSEMLNNYSDHKEQISKFCDETFLNIGTTSHKIMDILEEAIDGRQFSIVPLTAKRPENVKFSIELFRIKHLFYKELRNNYIKRYKLVSLAYRILRKVKRMIVKRSPYISNI